MPSISYVSVPLCTADGTVIRVVKVTLEEMGALITMKGLQIKAVEKALGSVALA